MTEIRSKNVYELLGNDPELDPNRAPEPPTKAIEKTGARVGKRDAPKEAPVEPREPTTNNRRGGRTQGNDAAFRDRNAGSRNNLEKPTEEGSQPQRRNRDDRGGRARNDRQNRSGVTDSRKQVGQGWGGQSGEKEFDDEKAGQKIALSDEKDQPQTPAEEEEPVDKSKSFADYLAEKAAAGDLSAKPVRSANEGTKADDKWSKAKELKRNEEEAEYIKGKEVEKSKAPRQRKEKAFIDVDPRFVEAPRTGGNGPRGGGRGGRGDRGAGRGSGRGGRGSGAPRGGGERGGPTPVTVDESNFPSLGSK